MVPGKARSGFPVPMIVYPRFFFRESVPSAFRHEISSAITRTDSSPVCGALKPLYIHIRCAIIHAVSFNNMPEGASI